MVASLVPLLAVSPNTNIAPPTFAFAVESVDIKVPFTSIVEAL